MNQHAAMPDRRFYRDRDRAVLGGVCAGISDYFGFNLKVTRFLAVIAFLMAMPMAAIGYLAVVLLVPSASLQSSAQGADPEFKRAIRSSPSQTMSDVRRRFQSLDRRLARLEKYVTSSRYQLDQEFRNL
jgi:phage shock protein C